jgi:hypothetical protein
MALSREVVDFARARFCKFTVFYNPRSPGVLLFTAPGERGMRPDFGGDVARRQPLQLRERGKAVGADVGVLAVVLDHLRAHGDDVANLRVREAGTAQRDHRRRAQAVQREAFQFGDCVPRLGEQFTDENEPPASLSLRRSPQRACVQRL